MSLAAAARKWVRPTPEFRIFHMAAERATVADYKRVLEKYQPDVIGFSTLSADAPGLEALLPISREIVPDAFLVIGGPHATIFPDRALGAQGVDAIVLGEGELTFCELLDRLQSGTDWRDIEGIAYRKDGKDVYTSKRAPIENLDELPAPAWDLIEIKKYTSLRNMNGPLANAPYMPIFTSRACPFGCIYCHRMFGKRVRMKSAKTVVDEIATLNSDFGVREIHVFDDIFNWDIERAKDICRGIIEREIRVKIAFPNGVRSDRFDDELIELMAKAGVYSMTFAIETASPRLQRLIRKNMDLEKARYNMKKAYMEGIMPFAFFMLGFPTETLEEMETTIRFAETSYALKANFWIVLAYPATELYELAVKNSSRYSITEDTFKDFGYWSPVSCSEKFDGRELAEISRKAMKRFYLKPWRILNALRMCPKNRWFLLMILYSLRMFRLGRTYENMKARFDRVVSGLEDSSILIGDKRALTHKN